MKHIIFMLIVAAFFIAGCAGNEKQSINQNSASLKSDESQIPLSEELEKVIKPPEPLEVSSITITARIKRPSDARTAVIKGCIRGDPSREPPKDTWIQALPDECPPSVERNQCFYRFPPEYGLFYRPIPLGDSGKFKLNDLPVRSGPLAEWWILAGATGYAETLAKVDLAESDIEIGSFPLKWRGISRLRIRALFEDGTPVSRRMVHVLAESPTGMEDETQACTDNEGYALLLVKPGSWKVCITKPTPSYPQIELEVKDGELRDLVIRIPHWRPFKDIELEPEPDEEEDE